MFVFLATIFLISGCKTIGKGTATGRYIRGTENFHLILIEEGYSGPISPCTMYNTTGNDSIFDSLQTGDKIRITCDGYRETYPLQTDIYSLKKLENGNINDIPKEHIQFLTENGWMEAPVVKNFEAKVEGKQVRMQLNLFPGWEAQEVAYTGEEYSGCGLLLRCATDAELEVNINYYPYSFAMCGTGVDFENIIMNNGQPATLATEKRHDGGIWVTLIMGDMTREDSFVAQYHLTKEQKNLYQHDILDMLLGLDFQVK